MNKDQSLNQLDDLFLTGNQREDLVICSDLTERPGGFWAFETMCIETGDKFKVTFKVEEIVR